MMVIVPHAVFIKGYRTNGLNLSKDSALDHRGERVVDGLLGDRTEVLCCHRCNVLGGGVWVAVHGAQYGKTLALLEVNPHHPSLRLHALSGKLQSLHSVSINLSYRITLELLIQDGQIIPVNVGDHDAVY